MAKKKNKPNKTEIRELYFSRVKVPIECPTPLEGYIGSMRLVGEFEEGMHTLENVLDALDLDWTGVPVDNFFEAEEFETIKEFYEADLYGESLNFIYDLFEYLNKKQVEEGTYEVFYAAIYFYQDDEEVVEEGASTLKAYRELFETSKILADYIDNSEWENAYQNLIVVEIRLFLE